MVGLLKPKKIAAKADRATDAGSTRDPGQVGTMTGQRDTRYRGMTMPGASAPRMLNADPANQLTQTAKRAMNPAPTGLMSGFARAAPKREVAAPGQRSVGAVSADRIPGVSGRLRGLLRDNSDYLRHARSRATRAANRRGLQNSSIAAGAGEEAAIAAALPIAQSDAQIAAGERALESQEFQQGREISSRELMQQRDHRIQQLMQQRGLSHEAAQNEANRELQDRMQQRGITSQQLMQQRGIASAEYMQGRDLTSRESMQQRQITSNQLMQQRDHLVQQAMQQQGLSHDAAQRSADRQLQDMMQNRDLRVRQLMQREGLDHDSAQRQADRELSDMMQGRQIASNERVAEAQRELQDLINQRNIRSQELMQERGLTQEAAQREADRELSRELNAARRTLERETLESSRQIALFNAASRNYGTYQQSIDRINANPELPPEERAEQLKQAQQAWDVSQTIQQQISGIEYDWPTYQAAN